MWFPCCKFCVLLTVLCGLHTKNCVYPFCVVWVHVNFPFLGAAPISVLPDHGCPLHCLDEAKGWWDGQVWKGRGHLGRGGPGSGGDYAGDGEDYNTQGIEQLVQTFLDKVR